MFYRSKIRTGELHADQVFMAGVPMAQSWGFFGDTYFVDAETGKGSDTYSGKKRSNPTATVSAAINSATTNNNDRIIIDGNTTVTETEMIDLTKNRLHLIGDNGPPGHYGQGAKVSLGVTGVATNIATLKNTGVRNTFSNIKFMNSDTVAEGLYTLAEGGEYTRLFNVELYKSSHLNVTGAAELLLNGDSFMMYGGTIGSLANAIVGAIIRPAVLLSRETIAGKVARDCSFEGTLFWRNCGNAANRFMYGANATDVERMLRIVNCEFWNAKLAAAVPAQVIAFAATQTQGEILLKNTNGMNCGTALSTTTGVFTADTTPDATGAAAGIPVQCA